MITHSFYDDDNIIFLKATHSNFGLQALLILFCRWTDQKINFQKSSIIFSSNISHHDARRFAKNLNVKVSPNPGKYLGTPSLWTRTNIQNFKDVLDRIAQRFSGWKKRSLDFAGHNTLIKASIDPIANHLISIIRLPLGVTKAIDKMHRDFLWEDINGRQKRHFVSWDTLCHHSTMGGLGIRNLSSNNLAFMAKMA